MSRLLARHGIGELEQLFKRANGDSETLRALADELQHRKVPRAIALLDKVQRALRGGNAASERPAASSSSQQAALWTEPPKVPANTIAATTTAQPTRPSSAPVSSGSSAPSSVPPVQTPVLVEVLRELSVGEACRILDVTPGATWESIEEARRQLVQKAHPQIIATLSPEQRARLQSDAKRANAAYSALLKARTS